MRRAGGRGPSRARGTLGRDEPGRARVFEARRLVVLVVLAVLCTVTLAPHVRLYVQQERDAAALRQEIQRREASIEALQGELDLWGDDAYVAAQARERLGYIQPGDTSYVTVRPGGEPAAPTAPPVRPGETAVQDLPWYRAAWAQLSAAPGP